MPRKDQRPCDDRNLAWSSDKGRFGYQMLEKMGWKEGKGLGATESGTTEHIKVKKKIDNQGIGTETSTPSKNWLSTSVAYESILANLNASYGAKSEATEPAADEKPKAKEESKGVVGRPRKVLYSRMLRAKDLANYSAEDKSAIFGGVPHGAVATEEDVVKQESKPQEVGSESEEMEEEEDKKAAEKEEDKGEEEEDKEVDVVSGVTTTTSAVSMQDYFKMRMAEMARKRAQGTGATLPSTDAEQSRGSQENGTCTTKQKDKKRKREEHETTVEPSSTASKKDKKKKKKSKKHEKEEDDAAMSKKDQEKSKKKVKKGEEKKKKKKKAKKEKKTSS